MRSAMTIMTGVGVAGLALAAGGQEIGPDNPRVEDCCEVVLVDRGQGLVTVRHKETGAVEQFSVGDEEQLRALRPGMSINSSFTCVNAGTAEERCWDGTLRGTPPTNFRPASGAGGDRTLRGSPPADFLRGADGGAPPAQTAVPLATGVTVTVRSLTRVGSRAVRLDFTVENATDEPVRLGDYGNLMRGPDYSLRDVSLVDYEAGQRYGAIVDGDGICACSRGRTMPLLEAGQTRDFWVQLTAPPADVDIVSIDFAGAASLDNVSIP